MTITKLRPRRPIGLACSSRSVTVHFAHLEAPLHGFIACVLLKLIHQRIETWLFSKMEKRVSLQQMILMTCGTWEDNEGNTKYFEDEM